MGTPRKKAKKKGTARQPVASHPKGTNAASGETPFQARKSNVFCVRLPPELRSAVEEASEAMGISASELVKKSIRHFVAPHTL